MQRSTAVSSSVFLASWALSVAGCAGADASTDAQVAEQSVAVGSEFVKQNGPRLSLAGQEFRAVGTNVYYLGYKSQGMVDDVLTRAADQGVNVLRTWAGYETGSLDGSNTTFGKADGVVYYQFWDGSAPAYNDGDDGLKRLDYAIYKAGQVGIRLVLPLVNNWSAFGGMDQYVRWAGGQYHDQFYTDARIRGWYKSWVRHLLEHKNFYTGVAYKDDPTIMGFELANEPRCKGSGTYPPSSTCSTRTLVGWADEMSRFIRSIDNKHLLSVGDEGFYCKKGATDWTEDCSEGVDTLAFARLSAINVLSFHMYPDHWNKDRAWGKQWITRHIADAKAVDKPILLGEFGLKSQDDRNPVYQEWTDAVFTSGGSGALYWMLAGKQDDMTYYPDYDGFTVYCPGPVCTTLRNFFATMKANHALSFAPVADHNVAETEHDTAISLPVTANDIAYNGAAIVPASVDLNPATPELETFVTVPGGALQANPDGSVLVTPIAGFAGEIAVDYVVSDSQGRRSNLAHVAVTVRPDPNAILHLFSFESGTDGWAAASWQSPAGVTSQSADFATAGSYSLRIDPVGGQWYQVSLPAALDLTGKTKIKWDLRTTGNGTSQQFVIKDGVTWQWCEAGNWTWFNENSTNTVTIDLQTLSCPVDLSQVREMLIFAGNGGSAPIYLDDIRAE
jgi:mannan endo-1,4-beta-mannosidase